MASVRFPRLALEIDVPRGTTLREAAHRAGAPVGARCSANGRCPTCRVEVRAGAALLDPPPGSSWCLACTTRVGGDGVVELDLDRASFAAYLASVGEAERERVRRLVERGPATQRDGPVPIDAIEDLLASVDACAGRATGVLSLVDVDVAARTARRFKLDVSFAFAPERMARFSVNDKGEPEAFRERLERATERLGLDRELLRAQLAIATPGEVQTTVGVKWRAGESMPDRVSVYFEELSRSPERERIRDELFALAGMTAPTLAAGAEPVAVCIDVARGRLVAVKHYDAFCEREGTKAPPLPAPLDAARDGLPLHAALATRRYMIASRFRPGGALGGRKLLWMTEIHDASLLPAAWDEVDLRSASLSGIDPHAPAALRALRHGWRHAPGTFLHPDLVAVNVGATGEHEALIVHVSVR